jgi:hypothetical protein
MSKLRLAINIMAVAVFSLAISSVAQAQATRTWVSGVGDDANPCSRTAPCKTFAGAISKTAALGEINVLDPGGFGAVTITKAITISSESFEAGVLVSGTNGIIINAANADVTLRGLDFNGLTTGLDGIKVLAARRVAVENCTIYGFANGIEIATTASVDVSIRNTIVRNNVTDGLVAATTAGTVRVSIVDSSFVGNVNGVHAKQNSRVTAFSCVFSANTSNGVFAEGAGGIAAANISKSQISNNNGNGVQGGGGASTQLSVVRINDCDIHQNGQGALVSTNGEVDTWSNNRIIGNSTDLCPGCTSKGFN